MNENKLNVSKYELIIFILMLVIAIGSVYALSERKHIQAQTQTSIN